MSDDDIKNYHVGISFENAARAYVGMIETGEVGIDRVRMLAPPEFVAVVDSYFDPETDIDSFKFF
jgi:hypothetical protein